MSNWNFDANQHAPWAAPPTEPPKWRPDFADNADTKALYGIELAKAPDGFKAGLVVFAGKDEVRDSLWATQNWSKDPVVIANRDAYLKAAKLADRPLTKDELSAKLLAMADEKDVQGRYLVEPKVRVDAFKLYSDMQGYTGKVSIDASTNSITTNNNMMKITLVKPDQKVEEPKVIEASNTKSEMTNDDQLPIKLKLVGGVR